MGWMTADRERRIGAEVARQGPRLRSFIRRRVPDAAEAEDIFQDVLEKLVQASRALEPIEEISAWLYRAARNRIVDLWRRRREAGIDDSLEDLLPSPDAGPEAAYARALLLEELDAALAELPSEQREVFVAHELEGRSFKEIAEATGVGVNTLLSRKRYAVLHLRARLRSIYDEFLQGG
jgi:RNA polymerase sigma factor (sigma-70 family)